MYSFIHITIPFLKNITNPVNDKLLLRICLEKKTNLKNPLWIFTDINIIYFITLFFKHMRLNNYAIFH